MNNDYLLSLIKKLLSEKEAKGIAPLNILANDLYKEVLADTKHTLNKLYVDKKINVGKTLNDLYITLNETK